MEKSCFILCQLVSKGQVPLLCLNDVISGVLRGWPSRRVGWLLLQAFYQCRLSAGSNTGVSQRAQWLLELMGLMRNVAYGVSSVPCRDTKLATDFLFQVFAAAVISWGDHLMPLLLGVRAQWFPWQPASRPPALGHGLYGEESQTELVLPLCLLGTSPRSVRAAGQRALEQPVTQAALSTFNASADFRKKAVWTRAYGWEPEEQLLEQ
ncbi:unnamed protein product [Lampetra planeri]